MDSLLPLGRLPPDWPHQGDRNPAALFPLGTDDGLAHWVLVVTGPERGRVWLVTDVGAYPYPLPKALGFLDLRPVAALLAFPILAVCVGPFPGLGLGEGPTRVPAADLIILVSRQERRCVGFFPRAPPVVGSTG